MEKRILLSEGEFHTLVENMVKRYLKEYSQDPSIRQQEFDAWNEYEGMRKRDDSEDFMNIELDRNMNSDDTRDMASAYSRLDDPMIKKIKGSTLRDRLSNTMGNDIHY